MSEDAAEVLDKYCKQESGTALSPNNKYLDQWGEREGNKSFQKAS